MKAAINTFFCVIHIQFIILTLHIRLLVILSGTFLG